MYIKQVQQVSYEMEITVSITEYYKVTNEPYMEQDHKFTPCLAVRSSLPALQSRFCCVTRAHWDIHQQTELYTTKSKNLALN